MRRHIHLTQEEQQRIIREGIARQGFALLHVLASTHEPAYSYTVGLFTPGRQRPELVMSGLKTEHRVAWLLALGFRMQGPPPLATRRRIAREKGVPLDALVYPPGGEVFEPGKRYLDLADNQLPTCFAQIDPAYYQTHLGQAIVFHGSSTCPVLQVIWPDPCGLFPWETNVDRHFVGMQRLLFDPHHFMQMPVDMISQNEGREEV